MPSETPSRAIWLTLAVEAGGIEHPEPWHLPWLSRLPILTARARFQCQMPCGHVVWGSYDIRYSADEMRRNYHDMFRKLWDSFVMSRLSLEAEPCPRCGATTAPPEPTYTLPDDDEEPERTPTLPYPVAAYLFWSRRVN